MKQPKIKITDKTGKDWGLKNIVALHWNARGEIWVISVDFMGNGSNDFSCFYLSDDGITYANSFGNLFGTLEFYNQLTE